MPRDHLPEIIQVPPTSADAVQPSADRTEFIRSNTRLLNPPLVPEIKLHLAEESLPIWRKTEEELGEMGLPPPYWAFAWAGGQALARYVLDNPALVRAKRVVDLGTGSGLSAIAAGLAGAASVCANDIDAIALQAARLNATVNGVSLEMTSTDLLAADPAPVDVVLVGDLFYERPLAERVITFLLKAKAGGAAVFVGDPRRNYFQEARFDKAAEYAVPVTRELEDAEIKRTSVWTLKD